MTTVTFAHDDPDLDASPIHDALNRRGFLVGPSRVVTHTVLDTVDGRLGRSGVRLEIRRDGGYEVVLTAEGGPGPAVPAAMNVSGIPQTISELPAGPLRSRVRAIAGTSDELRPVASFTATERTAVLQNADDKTVATAVVFEKLQPDIVGISRTIELRSALGQPPAADQFAKLLDELGYTMLRCDTAAAAVRLAAARALDMETRDLRIDRVVLHPEMPAIDGYRAVLSGLHETIGTALQSLAAGEDPATLKTLRIAVRRSRTVLTEGNGVIAKDVRRRFITEFVWLASVTGTARDLDVSVLGWEQYVAGLAVETIAALDPVRAYFVGLRQGAHEELTDALRSKRTLKLQRAWSRWLTDPLPSSVQPPTAKAAVLQQMKRDRLPDAVEPLSKVVAERTHRLYRLLIERGRAIDGQSPAEELHEVRKIAKQLRYLLDCFAGGLHTDTPKTFVKRLKALQDRLGEHQDADVHFVELQRIVGTVEELAAVPETVEAIDQLLAELDARRHRARDGFAKQFDKFDSEIIRAAVGVMTQTRDS